MELDTPLHVPSQAPAFAPEAPATSHAVVSAPPARAALVSGGRVAAIVPADIEQVFRLARAISAARWAPKSYMVDPKRWDSGFDESKIVVGILHGMELGLTPIAALQSIAVINGTPSIFGDGALAIVQASGLLEDFREDPLMRDGMVVGYQCNCRRRGMASPIVQRFTLEDASTANLLGKPGPWQEYRSRMLQMRARAWALRAGFADVLRGLGIVEEAQDLVVDAAPALLPAAQQEKRPTKGKKDARAALDAFAGSAGAQPPPSDISLGGETQGKPDDPLDRNESGQ